MYLTNNLPHNLFENLGKHREMLNLYRCDNQGWWAGLKKIRARRQAERAIWMWSKTNIQHSRDRARASLRLRPGSCVSAGSGSQPLT